MDGRGAREGKSESRLKKEGYSYRGRPQASNRGGYMNSLLLFLSLSSLCPSICIPPFPLRVNSSFTVWSWGDQRGPLPPTAFHPIFSSLGAIRRGSSVPFNSLKGADLGSAWKSDVRRFFRV